MSRQQVSAQATAELKRIAGIGRALLAQHGKSWCRFGSIDLGWLEKRGQGVAPGTLLRIKDLHRQAMVDSDQARLDLMTYAFLSGASVEGIACLSYAVSKECAKESGSEPLGTLTPADVRRCKEELRNEQFKKLKLYVGCQWPDPEQVPKVAGPLVCKWCQNRGRHCERCKQPSEVDALLYGRPVSVGLGPIAGRKARVLIVDDPHKPAHEAKGADRTVLRKVFVSRDLIHDGCIIREVIPRDEDGPDAIVLLGGQATFTDTKRDGPPACERAPRYHEHTDKVERTPAANFDGSPHDLLGPPKPKPAPIPLKVPAKVHSHNAGFWMQRAINLAAAPRDIRHVLLDGFE